jgi:hypothetical protein
MVRPMKRAFLAMSLLCASLAQADAPEALRAEDAIDEISAIRAADEAGDQALAKALGSDVDRESKLVAVRAAAHAGAPEALVPSLVELALSRDPNLAPEAAWALVELFERLTVRELAEREVLNADLQKACAPFADIDDAKKTRADIAQALTFAAARCSALMGETAKPE